MDIMKMRSFRESKPFKVDRNGTQYFADWTCKRCGGAGGADEWQYTGYTCYDCGGTGMAAKPDVWKVYTPEYEAKLNARRKARQEKREAERREQAAKLNGEYMDRYGFDYSGQTWVYLGNTYEVREELKAGGAKFDGAIGWHSARQIDGHDAILVDMSSIFSKDNCGVIYGYSPADAMECVKAAKQAKRIENDADSKHVGTIGERIEMVLTLTKSISYETMFGYMHIHLFKDDNGNVLTWKTSTGSLGTWEKTENGGDRFHRVNEYDKVKIKATIKAHTEYKGTKQTELTRCKVIG